MADTKKPIKRSPQLAPLSREHHESLLAAWKIKQGLAKNIEATRMAAFVQWFWETHLQHHFQKEEQAFPMVLPASNPLLQQMVQEHEAIQKLITEIRQHEDLKKLGILAQRINDHIRFEERQLFNEVEKTATPEQLEYLSEQIKDEKNEAIWEDEFWTTT